MWGHPWLPLLVTATIITVLVSMALDPKSQVSLVQSVIALVAIVASYPVFCVKAKRKQAQTGTSAMTPESGQLNTRL
jgi:GABA permease